MTKHTILIILLCLNISLGHEQLHAEVIRVAVAANFTPTLKLIAHDFKKITGHQIQISSSSTGKHFAQIQNGAPFDIFFAADRQRPEALEQSGVAQKGTRFTYALGKIVLWSLNKNLIDNHPDILKNKKFKFLSIANPKLAPYGRAALQYLEALKLMPQLKGKIVRGENITQAFQYILSGNADLGFIAKTQAITHSSGFFWEIPQDLYTPIEQQAILIKENPIAKQFLTFVKSRKSLDIIKKQGYGIPSLQGHNDGQ